MTIVTHDSPTVTLYDGKTEIKSFEQAVSLRDQVVWQRMQEINVGQSLEVWFRTLSEKTALNYRSAMRMFNDLNLDLNLVNPVWNLQEFSLVNHRDIINRIKQTQEYQGRPLSECTKQARAACYISFTRYLSEKLDGNFRRAIPSREGNAKTFFRVREVVDTEAMTRSQWTSFLNELHKINPRDCLIAKIVLQGAKRINEVLSLTTNQITADKCEITFVQSKTKGYYKETIITYPKEIIDELLLYIGERTGNVFVSRSGKGIMITQLANTFSKAGEKAGIPFKVSPHVLRASSVTYLKEKDFSDTDIMKVTGHASAEMVRAYDKSSRAENASKKVNLV
jgi:integrase